MKTKKELKTAYREMKPIMGVFQVKNLSNQKVFIDQSLDMDSKWRRHQMELKIGSHRNKALQKEWNEMGEKVFVFEVLFELKRADEEGINYQKELQTLLELVLEEIDSDSAAMYN